VLRSSFRTMIVKAAAATNSWATLMELHIIAVRSGPSNNRGSHVMRQSRGFTLWRNVFSLGRKYRGWYWLCHQPSAAQIVVGQPRILREYMY
jgi:hypothetical protein